MAGITEASAEAPALERIYRISRSKEFEDQVAQSLLGKEAVLLVVGNSGAGKSTLVNTLTMMLACETGNGPRPVTDCLRESCVELVLGPNPNDKCRLKIIDSPGRTGGRRNDLEIKRQLEAIDRNSVNVLLCCFQMTNNSGRFAPLEHVTTLEWLEDIFGEEFMRTKCIIVLTKGNKLMADHLKSSSTSSHGARPVENQLKEWQRAYKEHLRKPEEFEPGEADHLIEIPVYTAGMVLFDGSTEAPKSRAAIDGSCEWHDQLWNGLVSRAGVLGTVLYHINVEVQKKWPKLAVTPDERSTKTVALFVASTLILSAGAVVLGVAATAAVPALPIIGGIAAGVGAAGMVGSGWALKDIPKLAVTKLLLAIEEKEKKE